MDIVPEPRPIRAWPEAERPRERLLAGGPQALTDAQLLAIVLHTGDARRNAVQMGIELLAHFGGLGALAQATASELRGLPGVGPAKAAQLQAALELGRRAGAGPLARGARLRSSRDVFAHFGPRLRDRRQEVFAAVLLDGKHRVLQTLEISVGSLTQTIVHPREVFKPAVRESAAAIILVHNHPSGDPTPSAEDRALTARLVAVGEVIGIQVLDHVVSGDQRYVSFADEGWIAAPRR